MSVRREPRWGISKTSELCTRPSILHGMPVFGDGDDLTFLKRDGTQALNLL